MSSPLTNLGKCRSFRGLDNVEYGIQFCLLLIQFTSWFYLKLNQYNFLMISWSNFFLHISWIFPLISPWFHLLLYHYLHQEFFQCDFFRSSSQLDFSWSFISNVYSFLSESFQNIIDSFIFKRNGGLSLIRSLSVFPSLKYWLHKFWSSIYFLIEDLLLFDFELSQSPSLLEDS